MHNASLFSSLIRCTKLYRVGTSVVTHTNVELNLATRRKCAPNCEFPCNKASTSHERGRLNKKKKKKKRKQQKCKSDVGASKKDRLSHNQASGEGCKRQEIHGDQISKLWIREGGG